MEKRIISILLTITILFAIFPLSVSAEDSNNVVEYSLEDMEYISNKYFSVYKGIEQDICNSENVAYWKMTKKYQENGFWNWALNTASGIVGEKPDKKRCAEILINLITLQEGELVNQIENQSRFDDLKNAGDYVFDVVGIATSFFGASGNDTADTVSAFIETVFDAGKLSVVENKEQAKYYQASIQDYSRMDYFLNSVEKYAKIEELREAASELRKVNKNLLMERLEYIGDTAESIGKFEGTFFMKNMFYELIKDTDTYKTDEATKWFADGAERATKAILSIGGFAYKITMLAGDIGFGTTDTFNRYQEMKVAADIAQSLTQSIQKIEVKNSNDMETIGKIQSKCDYYDLLLTVHSRGEYLMYKLLMEDAGLCSQFRALFDLFKEPDETTEAWYMRQINAIESYSKTIDEIFDIKFSDVEWVVEPTIEADNIEYVREGNEITYSTNELQQQFQTPYAVIRRGNVLGLIDMEGNLKAETDYKAIYNYLGSYLLESMTPRYSEEKGYEWSWFYLDESGNVRETSGTSENYFIRAYYWCDGLRCIEADADEYEDIRDNSQLTENVIPVKRASEIYDAQQGIYPTEWVRKLNSPYAICKKGKLITDFIYEKCGSESNGMLAVCKDGKWGYIDDNGETVIPLEYDASWNECGVWGIEYNYNGEWITYDYCYAASDGYINLCKGDEWELRNTKGEIVIESGIFEAIRPVFDGKCWVKKDGKWGVIQIEDKKEETRNTEDNSDEDTLKKLLMSYTSEELLNFIYDDFDNNGVYEAIAFCGEHNAEEGSYFGTLYLVTNQGVSIIREKDGYWNSGVVYDFGNVKIISITQYFTTGGISYYYQIIGNEIVEIESSGKGNGLFKDNDGRMCMNDSQYDASVDGTGHTWNVYYFYWDNDLKEYGGTEISIEEFSKYHGADAILSRISKDGFDITTIYKRANGIININCCDGWSNNNVRVLLEGEEVRVLPVTEDYYYEEGIIKPALIPEIATY